MRKKITQTVKRIGRGLVSAPNRVLQKIKSKQKLIADIDNSGNCITYISELSICIIPKKGAIIKGIIHRYIPTLIVAKRSNDTIIYERKVPIYPESVVPGSHCARYARLAAKEMFGRAYSPADAWNMRYENETLPFDRRSLVEGGIIGFTFPLSEYARIKDMMGETVKYTHIGLYIGESPDGQPLIAHKFIDETRVDTLGELAERGITPVEIIHVRRGR